MFYHFVKAQRTFRTYYDMFHI